MSPDTELSSSYPVWHPYTQHRISEAFPVIVKGDGPWLIDEDDNRILDLISSWWVTVHGHAHPHIADAIGMQAALLEQVIFAGFSHPQAIRLAERLLHLLPEHFTKVFFSDDGSTAVEVALKMAVQYWYNSGEQRRTIVAFENAYHGDTFGAMSVSERSVFTAAFEPLLFDVERIVVPAGPASLEAALKQVDDLLATGDVAAFIAEPLVLGAGGMLMYPHEHLDMLCTRFREEGIPVIFDEVMTGFGRTGKFFAMDHCQVKPDITCLSKGLTGGFMAMSVTACTQSIYDAFLSDDRSRTLFHGHSFTANPIACAAANASLDLFDREETWKNIGRIRKQFEKWSVQFDKLENVLHVRQMGTILAMNIAVDGESYLNSIGMDLNKYFLEKGLLIRPLGNILYLMPPYVTDEALLEDALSLIFNKLKNL